TVLATYLLALALGSLLLGPRRGVGATRAPLRVLVLAAVPVALLPFAIAAVGAWSLARIAAAEPTQLELVWIQSAAAGMLLVPSTLIGAAALPWLLRAASPTPEAAGRGTGRLLFMNTAGSALFALLTALLWLPLAGSAGVLRGAAGVYLGAGALVAAGRTRAVLTVAGAVLLLQPLVAPTDDAVLWRVVGATFAPERYVVDDAPLRFAEEGRVSTVVVRDREGRPELWVDSKIVASVGPTDRLHLALLGHLPMLLHPEPEHVAVIGLGTGISSRAVARWKPETLDIYELEPAVVEAARHFEAFDGGVPEGARVVLGDGRHGIERSGKRYDVVTSDPIHPGVAGAAALYGADHYRMLASRADIVCQWLPLYQMRLPDARLIVRTFTAVFENAYVFLLGPDAILVGAREPLQVDEARLRERLASEAGADLASYGLRAPGRLLGLLVQGPEGARLFAREGPLNTDDNLRLEFACARSWYADEIALIARFLRLGRTDATTLLTGAPTLSFGHELDQAVQFHTAMRVWLEWQNARAVEELELLLELGLWNDFARALRHETLLALARDELDDDRPEEAVRILRTLLATEGIDDGLRLDAAELLMDAGRVADARAVARRLAAEKGWPRARRLAGESNASSER
nr:tetratricopeptide repeat protein [Planctomycetota bacterium]